MDNENFSGGETGEVSTPGDSNTELENGELEEGAEEREDGERDEKSQPEGRQLAKGTEIHEKDGKKAEGEQKKGKPAEPKQAKDLEAAHLDALVSLKIDGKEYKMPARQAIQLAQKGIGSEKRFQEAFEGLKRLKEYEEADPISILKKKGVDPLKFAQQLVSRQLQWEEMDEKDRRIVEYQEYLRQYHQEKLQWDAQRKEQEEKEREAVAAKSLDVELGKAMKAGGFPQGPGGKYYVQRIAATMLGALKRNEDLSAEEAAARVKKNTVSDFRALADTLDAKAIQEWLGEANIKKLMDAEVARVTANAAPTAHSSARPGGAPVPATQSRKRQAPLSEREWDKYIDSLKR